MGFSLSFEELMSLLVLQGYGLSPGFTARREMW